MPEKSAELEDRNNPANSALCFSLRVGLSLCRGGFEFWGIKLRTFCLGQEGGCFWQAETADDLLRQPTDNPPFRTLSSSSLSVSKPSIGEAGRSVFCCRNFFVQDSTVLLRLFLRGEAFLGDCQPVPADFCNDSFSSG